MVPLMEMSGMNAAASRKDPQSLSVQAANKRVAQHFTRALPTVMLYPK